MSERKRIEYFTKDEVSEVLGLSGAELSSKVGADLSQHIFQMLEDYFSRTSFFNLEALKKANMPHVSLRVKTVHLMLDGFRHEISPETHLKILRSIGQETGFSFSLDFISFLKSRKIPLNYDALLEAWVQFDSSADWGKLNATFESDNLIKVEVKRNFLRLGYETDFHRHCTFFEGYIENVIDGIFLQWTRWIEKTPLRPPPLSYEVISVNEDKTEERLNDTCVFLVNFAKESLPSTRSVLANAIEFYHERMDERCGSEARKVLEYALKEKLGHPVDANLKTQLCIDECSKYVPEFDGKAWTETYGVLSKPEHISGIRITDTYSVLREVTGLVRRLSRVSLTPDQIASINKHDLIRKP